MNASRTAKGPFRLVAFLFLLFALVFCGICILGMVITGTTVGSVFAPSATTYVRAGPSMNPTGILMYDVAVWNQPTRSWDCRSGVYINSVSQVPGVIEVGKYYSMGIGPTGMVVQLSPIAAPTDLPRPNCSP